jgi:hypothetical protein
VTHFQRRAVRSICVTFDAFSIRRTVLRVSAQHGRGLDCRGAVMSGSLVDGFRLWRSP